MVKDLVDEFERNNALMFGGPRTRCPFYLHEEERIPDSAPVGNGLCSRVTLKYFKAHTEDKKHL